MKKITLFLFPLLVCFNAQNQDRKANTPLNPEEPISQKDIDYKKTSDSLLVITEKLNLDSEKKLAELKRQEEEFKKQQYQIQIVKKDIHKNLTLILQKLKEKNNYGKQNLLNSGDSDLKENEILINDEVFKIDSIYKKGNLFRKEKWVYIITFPNGTKKELK